MKDLVPILADKCLTCHQESKAKGKYRVDQFTELLKAGNSDEIPITPKQLEQSYFYHLLVTDAEEDRMPQDDDPLPKAQIELFKRWIEEGAKFDGPDPNASLVSLRQDTPQVAVSEKYIRPVPITSLTWSKNPQHWFSNGYGEVLLWDNSTKNLLRRYSKQPERIYAISQHPSKPWMAVAGGIPGRKGELVVTDLESGNILFTAPPIQDCTHAVAFSPDGKWLATGGTDKAVRVFNTENWKQVWRAEAHADWVMDLCFSPDSQWILSASRDRTVRSYQTTTGEPGVSFTQHSNAVNRVIFDADGQFVISASVGGQARRWKFSSPGEQKEVMNARSEITQLQRRGETVVMSFANGQVRLFNFIKKKPVLTLQSKIPRIYSLTISPDEQNLLLGGQGGKVQILPISKPQEAQMFTAAPGWKD